MNLKDLILNISQFTSVEQFENFISKNYALIQSLFYSNNIIELNENKFLIADLLDETLPNNRLISDTSNPESIHAFLLILADFYERYGFTGQIQLIQKYISVCPTQKRLKAAIKYQKVNDVRVDYLNNFNEILSLLAESYSEEDFSYKVSLTFAKFYFSVLENLNRIQRLDILAQLKQKFAEVNTSVFQFAEHELFKYALSLENENIVTAKQLFSNKVFEYELNLFKFLLPQKFLYDEIPIEESEYSNSLKIIQNVNFETIHSLSCTFLNKLSQLQRDNLFVKLKHGVDIIKDENSLYQYIYSYGNMHHCKLKESLAELPFAELSKNNIEIIDWGCGQGLGTVILYDYLRKNSLQLCITNAFLIEPSEIALKRAKLHVEFFKIDKTTNVYALNSDLDSIDFDKLKSNSDTLKIHIFSNIIDVPFFDLDKFIANIKRKYSGLNYFVCISPNIDSARNQRLEYFYQSFKTDFGATLIKERINDKTLKRWTGEPIYCKHCQTKDRCKNNNRQWTRYEKVFWCKM